MPLSMSSSLSSTTRNLRVGHKCPVRKMCASLVMLRITQDRDCQSSYENQCLHAARQK